MCRGTTDQRLAEPWSLVGGAASVSPVCVGHRGFAACPRRLMRDLERRFGPKFMLEGLTLRSATVLAPALSAVHLSLVVWALHTAVRSDPVLCSSASSFRPTSNLPARTATACPFALAGSSSNGYRKPDRLRQGSQSATGSLWRAGQLDEPRGLRGSLLFLFTGQKMAAGRRLSAVSTNETELV